MVKIAKKQVRVDFRIVKADEEQRLLFGVVYAPDEKDLHGDFATAPEIEKAAHSFALNGARIMLEHKDPVEAQTVETHIVRSDKYKLADDGEELSKGTWVLGVKVHDENVWKGVKDGTLTGFSMAGVASRVEEGE